MDPNACMDRILSASRIMTGKRQRKPSRIFIAGLTVGGFNPDGRKPDALQIRMEGTDPAICPAHVARSAVRLYQRCP